MINNYDPNFRGTHVIRVTFMQWDYVGHVAYQMGGNCHGIDLLNADFLDYDTQEDIERYVENDCDFSSHSDGEDCYWYSAVLKNVNGDELEVENEGEDFKRMIVAVEIVELKPEE